MSEIPLIDLKSHTSTPQSLARALHEAATSLGFLYLTNTDLDPLGIFQISKELFYEETREAKEQCSMSTKNLGYSRAGQESLDPSKPGDQKEVFNIGMTKQDSKLHQELPPKLRAREAALVHFQRQCHQLCQTLLHALALALELPDDTLTDQHKLHHDNTSILRLLRYPAPQQKAQQSSPRAGAHSDYGSLTLLFQEDQPAGSGLQVLPPTADPNDESAWQDVPVVPNAVLVNVGDALELQTSALYRSTVHRVVELPSASIQGDRFSIAFFNQPNSDASLKPLVSKSAVTANDIARMERKGVKLGEIVTADEHLQKRLAATYSGRIET